MPEDQDEDISAWREEVASVKPIVAQEPIVSSSSLNASLTHESSLARRAAAEGQDQAEAGSPLTLGWVELVGPRDVLGFKRDGVQEAVFKKLRLGKYPCQAVLDLHGFRLQEASHMVYRFISDQYAEGHRGVRVVHGRGLRSKTEPALLKRYCAHWLKQLPLVMAYHSAQPQEGGAGALYVLIKKNPEKKALNRQRHDMRRG